MAKEALVVPTNILLQEESFQGFLPRVKYDFISVINNNFKYEQRGEALEYNSSLKQIIPYVIIVNLKTKKVFAYRRANNELYKEVRLRNKWSCGVGGHIEREDNKNPVEMAMMRELMEEVKMKNYPVPKIAGYVNDDSGDVEKVHFGVVAIAETEEEIGIGDGEIAEGRFMSIDEIETLFTDPNNQIENWTKISWPFIKNYLLEK